MHSTNRRGNTDRTILELWGDWYTIIRAKEVYHTASDFSQSAVHWTGTESRIIMGSSSTVGGSGTGGIGTNRTRRGEDDYVGVVGGAEPILIEESWRRDGETLRLRDRRREDMTDRSLTPCGEGAVAKTKAEAAKEEQEQDGAEAEVLEEEDEEGDPIERKG